MSDRRRSALLELVTGVCLFIVICAMLLFAIYGFIDYMSREPVLKAVEKNPQVSFTVVEREFYLFTVNHDDHQWVVVKRFGSGGIALQHSPKCPCLKEDR